ncbi:MAG: HDIG domain-containing protein [Phycisphaerae bacterium]|nr:HDIG domain-containing protein [Phycisphaerae bacterium]
MNRDEAWQLLNEFTKNESLLKHGLAVEAAMAHYARHFGEDEELWRVVGLIHDFDYERWPDPADHSQRGAEILRERGVDETIVGAVLSHAEWNRQEYPLDSPLRKALSAVDELCGFITACALVRPGRLEGLAPKSVRKKMKTPAFAAAVSRDDIAQGAELLGIELNDHIAHVVEAMQSASEPLGLAPEPGQ